MLRDQDGSHSRGDAVDKVFLARISKIKVRAARGGSRRRRSVTVRGPRAWLISLIPMDDEEHASEGDLVEAERTVAEKKTELRDSDAGYV